MDGQNAEQTRLHAIVEGRVQGVGFRYFVIQKAEALGLTGWVRNRWDDTVEILAEGERQALEKLLTHVHKGPAGSFVSDVRVKWQSAEGTYQRFSVLPTA
jgi:acylphosphatase